MKLSQNPISGVVECYTDDGEYVGNIHTMTDEIAEEERKNKKDKKNKDEDEDEDEE